MTRLEAEYVLPLRWAEDSRLNELVSYLNVLRWWLDVTVVDGSGPGLFQAHAAALPPEVRHVAPGQWPGRNGKVAGVMTGVRLARHDAVVIADDDVRYTFPVLKELLRRLEGAALVVPQNFFLSHPWHARVDTARTLVNRALGGDYPGTVAVSRRVLLDAGGYDGDVLFENLELMRTVGAAGGEVVRAPEIFVGRVPPSTAHFARQRVRQAYDDFAQPGRLVAELLLLPALVALGLRRIVPRRAALAAVAGVAVAVAEVGRRRGGGARFFPRFAALWAPVWMLERAVCVWVAEGARLRGGARYAGRRLPHAGNPPHVIRRRVEGRAA